MFGSGDVWSEGGAWISRHEIQVVWLRFAVVFVRIEWLLVVVDGGAAQALTEGWLSCEVRSGELKQEAVEVIAVEDERVMASGCEKKSSDDRNAQEIGETWGEKRPNHNRIQSLVRGAL